MKYVLMSICFYICILVFGGCDSNPQQRAESLSPPGATNIKPFNNSCEYCTYDLEVDGKTYHIFQRYGGGYQGISYLRLDDPPIEAVEQFCPLCKKKK